MLKTINLQHGKIMEKPSLALTIFVNFFAGIFTYINWDIVLVRTWYAIAILWTIGQMVINREKMILATKKFFHSVIHSFKRWR